MRRIKNMELHSFYCINCGEKTYELMRSRSHQYSRHHRKVLYCPHCKQTVNCIECRNDEKFIRYINYFDNSPNSYNFLCISYNKSLKIRGNYGDIN